MHTRRYATKIAVSLVRISCREGASNNIFLRVKSRATNACGGGSLSLALTPQTALYMTITLVCIFSPRVPVQAFAAFTSAATYCARNQFAPGFSISIYRVKE